MTRSRKVIFGCVATVLVFSLAEFGLRMVGVRPAYQADFVGWRLPANQQGQRMRSPEGHDFRITTNEDGLRTRVPREKSPGALRVAVMGDSTVFGWGVEDGQDLSAHMEAPLRPRSQKRVELMNAAQPGYSTVQLSWLFHDTIAAYQPDIVLFFPPQHDLTPALVSDLESLQGASSIRAGPRIALSRHSRLYHLLWMALGGAPAQDTEDGLELEEPGVVLVPRVSDAERGRVLDGIQDALAAWDGRLVLGLMPFYPDLHFGPDAPGPDGPGVEWARDHTTRQNLGLVDLRHCCGPNADRLVFEYDKWHLNEQGNAAVGEAAGRHLADLLFPRK